MKIQINNGAYTIKSDVKTETLRKLEKYNKSALTLFNEKDEPVFTLRTGKQGDISKAGIIFDSTDSKGFACITRLFDKPYSSEKRQEIVSDLMAPIAMHFELLEDKIKVQSDLLNSLINKINDSIVIND